MDTLRRINREDGITVVAKLSRPDRRDGRGKVVFDAFLTPEVMCGIDGVEGAKRSGARRSKRLRDPPTGRS